MSIEKELLSKFSILFIMNGLGKAFILLSNILLARFLTQEDYGEFVFVFSVISILPFPTKFGLDQAVLKFVPEYEVNGDDTKIKGFNSFITLFSSVASLLLIVIIATNLNFFTFYIFGSINYRQVFYDQIFLIMLITLAYILASVFQSRKDIVTYSMSLNILQNGLFVVFIFFLFYINTMSLDGVIIVKYVSLIITIIYLIYKMIKNNYFGRIRFKKQFLEYKKVISFAIPMMFVGIIGIIITKTSVYLTGYFHDSNSVAILNSASQVAIVVSFMLQAINQVFAPYISKMYNQGDIIHLNNLYTKISYFMLFFSTVFLFLLVIFKNEVMGIFGPEYIIGANTMIIVAIGQVYNAITGPCEYMLTMTGFQKINLGINILMLFITITVGLLLIPNHGYLGGAISTLIALVVSNTIRVWVMYKKVGIVPFKIRHKI